MKKITFLMFVCLMLSVNIYAQPCIPGTYTNAGIYPDSTVGLPPAYVNAPYSTVITVVVPTDTILFSMPFIIDSIGVVSVTGLPAGFAYSGNPANGFIHGGASGCVLISGTPTPAQVGSYPIDITLINYVNSSSTGLSQTNTGYYTIHILDTLVYIEPSINTDNEMFNYPNPFSKVTFIDYISPTDENVLISIYNNIGQLVFEEKFEAAKGRNTFRLALKLEDGIYFYNLRGKDISLNSKMIIKN